MPDPTLIPIQDNFETTLKQKLDSTETGSIKTNAVPTATIPSGFKVAITVRPKTSKEEVILIDAIDTINVELDIAASGRAQDLGNGKSGTAYDHPVGSKVIISDPYILWNDIKDSLNSKVNVEGDTMTGELQFSGTAHAGIRPIALTTAQRTALSLSGSDTAVVYDTDLGDYYVFKAGSWSVLDTGTPAGNATETVAGIVEVATDAESISAASDTGGTGATIVSTVSQIAQRIQNQNHTYTIAAGTANALTATLTPAPSAYTAGQVFRIKAINNNTGSATININSLGVLTIKTPDGQALKAKAIRTDQLLTLQYDGTDMILLSASNPKAAKGDFVVATGDGTDEVFAAGNDEQVIVYDSSQTSGLRPSDPFYLGNKGAAYFNFPLTAAFYTQLASATAVYGGASITRGSHTSASAYGRISTELLEDSWGGGGAPGVSEIVQEFYIKAEGLSGEDVDGFWGLTDDNARFTAAYNDTAGGGTADIIGLSVDGSAGTLHSVVSNGGTGTVSSSLGTLADNTYTLIRIVANSTDVKYYINNTLVDTVSTNIPSIAVGSGNLNLFGCGDDEQAGVATNHAVLITQAVLSIKLT